MKRFVYLCSLACLALAGCGGNWFSSHADHEAQEEMQETHDAKRTHAEDTK